MTVPARWPWYGALAWTAAVIAAFVLAQVVFTAGYIAWLRPDGEEALARAFDAVGTDGDLLALGSLATTPFCLLALLVAVKSQPGATLADSLALHRTPAPVLLRWLAATAAFVIALDALNLAMGRPLVPEFMREAHRTADSALALLFVVVIVAPVFEELLFRGFLLTGLESSPLPVPARVAIASLAWTVLHVQYDAIDLAAVFALGLLLGAARARTGSLAAPLAMHVLVNLWASAETAWLAAR